ncbi:hypothetical protein [Pseudanabaena sp. UWO310]|uniref:hypothetical protein n=1 Tax=Pseudanabaena sp. UWO310 TaxID=2480795 RepID=UPI00115BD37D|nr:hypothetical protein [Pseudanabaena sp. UWO310]TYQ29977.1 hypothetical protein PseudUWO310_11190 [Pseudanabaena sp. UWO310]
MNPTPFYKYGLNLDIKTEQAIDALPLHELSFLLDRAGSDLCSKHYMDDEDAPLITSTPLDIDELSDMEKIGLIRGLCDRLEIKLMEVAK